MQAGRPAHRAATTDTPPPGEAAPHGRYCEREVTALCRTGFLCLYAPLLCPWPWPLLLDCPWPLLLDCPCPLLPDCPWPCALDLPLECDFLFCCPGGIFFGLIWPGGTLFFLPGCGEWDRVVLGASPCPQYALMWPAPLAALTRL